MNTNKSRIFTDRETANKIAKNRGKHVYLLGQSKQGNNVYFVGDYCNALKASRKYNTINFEILNKYDNV